MSVSNIIVNNSNDLYCKNLRVYSTSGATSTSTGALTVKGGIGCDTLYANNIHTVNISADVETILDIYHVVSTDDSTSVTTGAAIIDGGVGIGKSVYVGGLLHLVNTTDTTSISNGTLIVSGGIGAANVNTSKIMLEKGAEHTTILRNATETVMSSSAVLPFTIDETINAVTIKSTVDSSTVSTGALFVYGGVNINKRANIQGITNILNTNDSFNTANGSLIVAGGVAIQKSLNVGGNLTVDGYIDGDLDISSTVDASSITTGALIIDGGAGIAKNLYIGGNINITGSTVCNTLNVNSTNASTSSTTGGVIISGGVGILKDVFIGGNETINGDLSNASFRFSNVGSNSYLQSSVTKSAWSDIDITAWGETTPKIKLSDTTSRIYSTVEASSITTGALVIDGGVSVGKNLYINGSTVLNGLNILSTINSTSNTTGAITVLGGVGIVKDAIIGGGIGITSNATINGTCIINNSTASISGSTGALIVVGGIGTVQKIVCGLTADPGLDLSSRDNPSVNVINQTPTSTTALNDPKYEYYASRVGTNGVCYPSSMRIGLSRYENISTFSRSRMDIDLMHDNGTYSTALTLKSNGDLNTQGDIFPSLNGSFSISGSNALSNFYSSYSGTGDCSVMSYNGRYNKAGTLVVPNAAYNTTDIRVSQSAVSMYTSPSVGTAPSVKMLDTTISALTIYSTVEAIANNNAAVVVVGGVGIGKKLIVGGATNLTTLTTSDTTNSTNTSTGSVIISGGLGVAKDIYCSNIYSNGAVITITSANAVTTINGPITITPTLVYTRIGNIVTVSLPAYSGTSSLASVFLSAASSIPAGFVPTQPQNYVLYTTDNATSYVGGIVFDNSDRRITIFKSFAEHNFSASGTVGWFGTGFTYNV